MGSVSGSLSLDMTRLVREITATVVHELTRKTPEPTSPDDKIQPSPLATIAAEVTSRVGRLTSADLLRIERRVEQVSEVSDGIAERVLGPVMDRLNTIDHQVRDLDQIDRKLDQLLELLRAESARRDRLTGEDLAARGQGPAWTPEEPAPFEPGGQR
jgi:hypothetical protein